MYKNINTIQKYTELELTKLIPPDASWHRDYKDSAYVFVSNLHYDMNEGDVSVVFSQYGEPVDTLQLRDRDTGDSKGRCFLCYEDQRSTDLAVDNLNNTLVCGRYIKVDHVKDFKPPKEYTNIREEKDINDGKVYKPSGPDGRGWGEWRVLTDEEKNWIQQQEIDHKEQQDEDVSKMKKIDANKSKMMADEDERWEKVLMKQCDDFLDGGEIKKIKEKLEGERKKIKKAKKKIKKRKDKDKAKKENKKMKKDKKIKE